MKNNNKYIAIMAGGIGSRFWPSSTTEKPKQFLDILGTGKSLLQLTVERFLNIVPAEHILILTNQKYYNQVVEHAPQIPSRNIICEPSRNNTGPCVAYTALRLKQENPEAIFVTAPSDAVILNEIEFVKKIKLAFEFIEQNEGIVTLGIEPTRPDTGYGYIEILESSDDVRAVKQFKEKPDRTTAEQYISQGNYLWNAGIFIWKAHELVENFKVNAPDIIEVLSEDLAQIGSENEQAYINRVYPKTPNISVDYAILEKAKHVYCIPANIGWSDLGTWGSLYDYVSKDDAGNVQMGNAIKLIDSNRNLVRSTSSKQVLIKGLQDYVVIDDEDGLLIIPKADSNDLSNILKTIK